MTFMTHKYLLGIIRLEGDVHKFVGHAKPKWPISLGNNRKAHNFLPLATGLMSERNLSMDNFILLIQITIDI